MGGDHDYHVHRLHRRRALIFSIEIAIDYGASMGMAGWFVAACAVGWGRHHLSDCQSCRWQQRGACAKRETDTREHGSQVAAPNFVRATHPSTSR